MHLLRDRSGDLDAAGVRPFGISRDSAWSHRAWAETLGVDVPLLSDWNGDATRAFGIGHDFRGYRELPRRSAFVVDEGGVVRFAQAYEDSELPDFDEIVASVRKRRAS